MKVGSWRFRAFWFLNSLALVMASYQVRADDANSERLLQGVQGVYVLEEWHKEGRVFRPPQVEGRFVLQDGMIMTVLHNRIQAPNQTALLVYGSYVFDSTTFTYGYESTSLFTETPSDTTASHKPLFEGKRSFAISMEGQSVRFRSEGGKQELIFTDNSLIYSENGQPQRVWRRLTER